MFFNLVKFCIVALLISNISKGYAVDLASPSLDPLGNVKAERGTVNGKNVLRYTWRDSVGKVRSASLVCTGVANTTCGGYAWQFTYQAADGTSVVINPATSTDNGFGYFVSHELFRTFSDGTQGSIAQLHGQDDSPLSKSFPGIGTVVSIDTVKAVHQFVINYPHWGTLTPQAYDAVISKDLTTHKKYDIPAKITWQFINGVDYPLWGVEYDFSLLPINLIYADMRGPYGNMKFDVSGNAVVNGLEWGDKYIFTASPVGGGITTASPWTWNTLNRGARYNLLIAGQYEMGLVQDKPYIKSTIGSGWNNDRNRTSTQQLGCSPTRMPCDWEWTYQSIQYGLTASPTNNKKLAWGTAPFIGGNLTNVFINNTESETFSGYPKVAYNVWITFDKTGGVKTRNLAANGGQPLARTPFVGYFPSWLNMPGKTLDNVSRTFSHVNLSFAYPDIGPFTATTSTFNGTGLGFSASVAQIRASIANLQRDGVRVLLSVGGAQQAINVQGHANGWQNLISNTIYRNRLLLLANTLGVDGIDMDYEAATVNNNTNVAEYSNVLTILRNTAKTMKATNAAGLANPKIFSMAVAGVGADCSPANSTDPYCQNLQLNSAWAGAGVERRVLKANNLARLVDMVNVMTYDIGYYGFDPVLSYQQYRSLLPPGVPVNVGLEVLDSAIIGGPLGAEKSMLMVNDADVDAGLCPGTVMLNDQYSAIWNSPPTLRPINRPYSVETLANSINNSNKSNATKDGLMMWSLFRIESENLDPNAFTCKGVIAATPESARLRAAQIMKWPIDALNVD